MTEPPTVEPLAIDIFSDVICPWCLIGRERLRQALTQIDAERPIAVRWLPFELNPDMPKEGMDRREYVEAKFGSIDNARTIYDRITEAGRDEGIAFDFSRLSRTPNTFDAHRLIWLAGSEGRGDTVKDALFRAYFFDAADIGDHTVLIELAVACGLDRDRVAAMLDSEEGIETVRYLEQVAHSMGVSGVPFFIFDGRVAVSGAQPPETFLEAIAKADEMRNAA